MKQLLLLLMMSLMFVSCGADDPADEDTVDGMPNVESIANNVVPKIAVSGALSGKIGKAQPLIYSDSVSVVTYNGTADNFDIDRGSIANILGTNMSGVNTQIAVQMAQLQEQIEEINRSYIGDDGLPANCTAVID